MLISYANNFVVIRVPKTGSTTSMLYFLSSGLLDREQDLYIKNPVGPYIDLTAILNIDSPEDGEKIDNPNIEKPLGLPPGSLPSPDIFGSHTTFYRLVDDNIISQSMDCIGVIRHPVDWLISKFYAKQKWAKIRRMPLPEGTMPWVCRYSDPQTLEDFIEMAIYGTVVDDKPILPIQRMSQCDWLKDTSIIWNTENLHNHASNFILGRNGNVRGEWRARVNSDIPEGIKDTIPASKQQEILDYFADDYELWETAYAVYN